MIKSIVLFMLLSLPLQANATIKSGQFINPITDVAWQEIFTIKIAGITIAGADNYDTPDPASYPICVCPAPPPVFYRYGISVSFWEPARMIETVATPYYFPSLGFGLDLASTKGFLSGKNHSLNDALPEQSTFAQAHYLLFPVWSMLDLLTDFICVEHSGFDPRMGVRGLIMIMKILLLIFLLWTGNSFAGDTPLTLPDINAVMGQAAENASALKLPENQHEKSGRETAEALTAKFQSPEYQANIHQEQQRLQQEIFKDVLAQVKANEPGNNSNINSKQSTFYLFISSSVPITTLRSYAAMIDHARTTQIVMVLRGFVDGMKKVKPTMFFIGEILKKDKNCEISQKRCESYQANIQIDPILFQKFTIEKVPALVFCRLLKTG